MKQFIAVTTETQDNKLVLIQTSGGVSLYDENGITFEMAIEFLFNLIYKREHRKEKTVFVSYGFSRDNEFIFSTASKELKDKIFQSYGVKREIARIDFENEKLDEVLYNSDGTTQSYEEKDFQRYVNKLAKLDLIEVKVNDFYISLANGKRLTIRRRGKSISIYDIYGFFKSDSLQVSCNKFGIAYISRQNNTDLSTLRLSNANRLRFFAVNECASISKLAAKLDTELSAIGVNLSRYHGATAISSHILTKGKAKKEFYAYRYKRQLSRELDKACYQSYYGGRVEQFKLGTFEDVKIYDINSAYAYACTFLPVLLSKPVFVKSFTGENPFSMFYCRFDFRDINSYYGFMPTRDNSNHSKYKLRGAGYFWFPEVEFLMRHYPQSVEVTKGFYWDYERANFAETIQEFYEIRKDLQRQRNPLEKVIKKALQGIYGKFFQHQGKGHFFQPFYAGFICSFVRRLLLDATRGAEKETICFLTDAIHTTAILPVELSDNLGAFRVEHYDKVTYLDSGVYQCYNGGKIVKTKHKGSKAFDFAKALSLINETGYYKADNSVFIGHNIFTLNQFSNAPYLSVHNLDKEITPSEDTPRIFERRKIDYGKEYIDSKPNNLYGGRESLCYKLNDFSESDYSLDTINARNL